MMSQMNKIISIAFLMMLVLAGTSFAQNDLLSRVPQLQETARKATGGVLGCGKGGSMQLITSKGETFIITDGDPIHVFGNKVIVADLLTLLKARVKANRTGERNPMSGEVDTLLYITLSVLGKSKDPDAIPFIRQLLEDKNETVVFHSGHTLQQLADSDEELQLEIEKIVIPKTAVELYRKLPRELPKWVKVKEGS